MNEQQIIKSLKNQLEKKYTHADRKAFFTNYNVKLANRISEIKRNGTTRD